MIGTTISHYEVLDRLGGGGMGEVFKARDTLLNRFVAVKVLYPDAAADPVKRARMLEEARAAGALNHQNIVTLYDVIRQENADILVMEYVAGQTLADLIRVGAMRPKQAIEIALQVTSGLAAAHRAGLAHRDLKPQNVLLTAEGVAKIADFGLAKRIGNASGGSDAPTASFVMTAAGGIVGTPAYMSPEQVEGKPVDARTDVFSFGVVLYEMLSGKSPFTRDTLSGTLNAVVHEELPLDGFPRTLTRLLEACLQKEPYRRLDSIGSARLFLEAARDGLTSTSVSGEIPVPVVRQRPRWKRVSVFAGCAMVVAAAGFFTARLTTAVPDRLVPRRLTHLGTVRDSALSPDGKLLVFSSDHAERGNPDIWLQQVDDGAMIRLTSEKVVDDHPVFSADGTTVYFHSTRSPDGIYAVSVLGGEARPLLPGVATIQPSPDGKWLAYVADGATKTYVRPVSGGAPKEIGASTMRFRATGWSPNSETLGLVDKNEAFFTWNVASGTLNDTHLSAELAKLDFSQPRFLGWMRDGRFLFIALHEPTFRLWSVRMPPGTIASNLHPEPMTLSNEADLSAVPLSGRILITSGAEQYALWTIPGDIRKGIQSGQPQVMVRASEAAIYPSVDREQKTLAFTKDTGRFDQAFLQDLATGRRRIAAPSGKHQYNTVISPSGKQVAFNGDTSNTEGFVVSTAGGDARSIGAVGGLTGWTPDERFILYTSTKTQFADAAGIVEVGTGRRELILSESGVHVGDVRCSPNGKWLSFTGVREGRYFIGIAPFRGMERIPEKDWMVTEEPNYRVSQAFWAPGGRVLYYARTAQQDAIDVALWASDFDPDSGRFVGAPRRFYAFNGDLRFQISQSNSAAPLDDRIIFVANEFRSDAWLLEGAGGGK